MRDCRCKAEDESKAMCLTKHGWLAGLDEITLVEEESRAEINLPMTDSTTSYFPAETPPLSNSRSE